MKLLNCSLIIFSIFIFSFSVFTQTPTPTPPINDDTDVVKISTTLIQVDVTVTDKNGKIIKDLKPEDFEIYENQNKHPITNFSFIQPETEAKKSSAPENITAKENLSIPIPPARLKAENIRRTIAFVVDDLTLGSDSIFFTRKALKKFVDEKMLEGDLIAIIRTSAGVGALQQFTADKRLLYAAIEGINWKPSVTDLAGGSFAPFQSNSLEGNLLESNSQGEAEEKKAQSEISEYQQSVFASGTLGAMSYIVNGMKELPGRKSIMLISDKLSLTIRTDDEVVANTKVVKALNRLVETANRSAVVVYTMTANGIPYEGYVATPGAVSEDGESQLQKSIADINNKTLDVIESQQGLVKLAKDTGGFAIINQKELIDNIQVMIEDQKGYYLLGYQPDDETFDAKNARFNKLFVKVNRPDVIVRYRSGFFGITDEKVKTSESSVAEQQFNEALSSPFAKNDVNVHLAALFGNIAKGSFVRSFLYVQTKDLTFTDEPDGWKKTTFDIAAFASSADGIPISQIGKNYTFRVSPETYKEIFDKGFVYNFNLPIRKAGVYQLRLVLRDTATSKIGSASQFIDVPNLEKKRLTLSGITLEDFTLEEWQKVQQTQSSTDNKRSDEVTKIQNDTAFRRFKRGSILTFGYTIYNAKLDATKQPNLQTQMRLFRDGKIVLNGTAKPFDSRGQTDLARISVNSAISLANQMQTGEYVLQIVVTDVSAKEKRPIATQWIDFEVIN